MLPEGWRETKVDSICTLINGNGFKPKDWSTSGLPIIRIQNLNGSFDYNYYAGIPDERWIVNSGDLLFAWAGTKGVSFGPCIWTGEKGVLNQHIYKVEPHKNIDKIWLFLILYVITAQIESRAHGFKATLLHVHKKDITDQIIQVPPLPEQEKIAAILSAWDKAISTTDALLANSCQQKKALMQQLLTGKRRLPGFTGEWEEFQLLQRAIIIKGTQINKNTLASSGDYPVMNGGILPSGYFNLYNSPANSIIISEGGNSCGFVQYMKTCFWCGGHCYKLEIKYDFDRYIYHYLKFFENRIMALRVGSGLPNIQKERLASFAVKVPPLDEQRAIAAVLDAADKEIVLLEQKVARLREEKKALMQQLLTGKRRVRL